MTECVGFVGLGNMGLPMACRLIDRGFTVVAHDPSVDRMRRFEAHGGRCAKSLSEIAEISDRTICMVGTTAQTETVLLGAGGIAATARQGHIVSCMNTIDPMTASRLNTVLADKGIAMLDAPVSGGTLRAETGTLVVMVGGNRETFERCRDLYDAIGNECVFVGAAGQGMAMKLVNNMLAEINIVAMCEALVLACKAGLDLRLVCQVVRSGTGNSAIFEARHQRMLSRDFVPGGSVDICLKDQELQTAFASQLGMPLLLANLTKQVYQMAHAAGLGGEDAGAVLKVFESLSSLQVPAIEPASNSVVSG